MLQGWSQPSRRIAFGDCAGNASERRLKFSGSSKLLLFPCGYSCCPLGFVRLPLLLLPLAEYVRLLVPQAQPVVPELCAHLPSLSSPQCHHIIPWTDDPINLGRQGLEGLPLLFDEFVAVVDPPDARVRRRSCSV
jgi:hypothetical protein